MTSLRIRKLAALITVAALTATACSETTDDSSATTAKADATTAAGSMATETTAADSMATDSTATGSTTADSMATDSTTASSSSGADGDPVQWALDYTGGTAGAASGDSIKLGWANQGDVFPNADLAAQTAVDYVNKELGGVGGKPIELVTCNIAAPEDGAKCGGQFANDDSIPIAMTGNTVLGSADFYSAIGDSKATYISSPLGTDQLTSKTAVSYTTGSLGAAFGLAFYALSFEPKTVAGVVTDDDAGRAGIQIFEGVLKQAGVDVKPVFISPTATAPEVESAFKSAGAVDADVVVIGTFEAACASAYGALNNLKISGADKTILVTQNCGGQSIQDAVAQAGESGQFPNGWYFASFGSNVHNPDYDSGMLTFTSAMEAAGHGDKVQKDGAAPAFVAIMSMVKFLNEADGDYSAEKLNGLIRGFKGPAMIQAGPLECGVSQTFTGICGTRVGFSRYLDGEWDAVAEGDNSIDITPGLTAGNQ